MDEPNVIQDELAGQCPSCYGFGAVGAPCLVPSCAARALHCVPAADVYGAETGIDPLIGRLIDRYLIVGIIGSGGFGRVYRALELPIGMRVALKVAHLEGASPAETATLLARFEQEASALAALNHPNIVRLLRYGSFGVNPYLVMELVPGDRTLAQLLAESADGRRALTRRDVANVLFPLLDALGAAHAHGFVHRDVKPENIMLQPLPSGPPLLRLLDFGLARPVAMRSRASRPMGTPLYMAPEQLSGGVIGPWTDLYAVGVITCELIFGMPPFTGETEHVWRQKLDAGHDPIASAASAPPEIATFLRQALAVDPTERFRDAEEMRAALAVALGAFVGARDAAPVPRRAVGVEHRGAPTREARPVAWPIGEPANPDARDDDPRLLTDEADWFEGDAADDEADAWFEATDGDADPEDDDALSDTGDEPLEWRPRRRARRWLLAAALIGAAAAVGWFTLGPPSLVSPPAAVAHALEPALIPPAEPALITARASAARAARAADVALVGRVASCDAGAADLADLTERCDRIAGCRTVEAGARLGRRSRIQLAQPLEQGESLLLVLRSPAGEGACGARSHRGVAFIDGAWDVLPPGTGAYVQPQVVLVAKGAGHRRRVVLADRATTQRQLTRVHQDLIRGVTACLSSAQLGPGTRELELHSYEDVHFYSAEEGLSDERGLSPCELDLSRVLVVSSPAS